MAYNYIDPVAQSFFVDTDCVLTKVGLYFTAKDSNIPAFIHLRNMVNGHPGNYIVPFSEKLIRHNTTTLSTDSALNENIITFDSPIVLEKGEYALCVGSPSSNWKICVAGIGSIDKISNKQISLQPYVGALFKSQNASTWSPENEFSLTFKLYRAVFDITEPSNVEFTVNRSENDKVLLAQYPLEMVNGSNLLRVYHPNHGMVNGDYITISGVGQLQSLDKTSTYGGINFNTYLANSSTNEANLLVISNVSGGSYTVTLPGNSTLSTRFGGSLVCVTRNVKIDSIQPIIGKIEKSGTAVTTGIKLIDSAGTLDSAYTVIHDETTELESPRIIPSRVNGTDSIALRMSLRTNNKYLSPIIDIKQIGLVTASNLINNASYDSENIIGAFDETTIISATSTTMTVLAGSYGKINIPSGDRPAAAAMTVGTQLNVTGTTTTNNGDYRIVNIEEDGSIVYVVRLAGTNINTLTTTYTIVNGERYISEESAKGGTALARYITRQVDFLNPSTAFNLRILTNRPQASNISIYYKVKYVGEAIDLNEKEFTLTDFTAPISLNNLFDEVEYQIDSLTAYESIILKIVFTSTDTSRVPKCKNLRLISLA